MTELSPDCLDTRLLDEFQRDLPLVPRPFAAMADALGTTEGDVLERLERLQDCGRISRVGATCRPNTAGASTLAALAIPEARIEEVAALVGAEAGVNHSYLREDRWNLWFVATAPSECELAASLARIAQIDEYDIVATMQTRGLGRVHLVHGRRADEAALRSIHHEPQRLGLAIADRDAETRGQRVEAEELRVVLPTL